MLGDRRAALHDGIGPCIDGQGAQRADHVDPEVLEETPVLGRDHRVDQIWRQFVERDLVVVHDAAPPDLLAVAIEKGHREVGLFQPIVRCFLESETGKREGDDAEAKPESERLAGEFVQDTPPAGDMEPVHEGGKGRRNVSRMRSRLVWSEELTKASKASKARAIFRRRRDIRGPSNNLCCSLACRREP